MKKLLTEMGLLYREQPVRRDDLSYDAELWQKLLNEAPGTVDLRIDHIIDAPHFVEKDKASLLQFADFCAFALRRCLAKGSHGDDLVYAMLGPDEGDHFVRDPVWHRNSSSGLFSTRAYWTDEQHVEYLRGRSDSILFANLASWLDNRHKNSGEGVIGLCGV